MFEWLIYQLIFSINLMRNCLSLSCSDQTDKQKAPEEEGGIMEALSRPLFKKVPEDREVREGNTVRFDTLVSGRPVPELTWFRDDVQVHNDDQHKVRFDPKSEGNTLSF